jgi:hypothetical protein
LPARQTGHYLCEEGETDQMNKLRVVAVVTAVLLVIMGASAFAQGKLGVSSRKPSIDGVIQSGEYSFSQDFDQQITLYASRSGTTLYLAVVGNTSGWVAVGLGAPRMDGADIFMGFVKDGKVTFKPQVGKGHRHGDAPADVADTLVSYAMKEAGGKTTLEVALKAGSYIKGGQSSLDVIFAMGDQGNFTQYHSYRGATSLALSE